MSMLTPMSPSAPSQDSRKTSWRNGAALNFVLFQAGWFACVQGAASGMAWAGALCVAAIVGWHVFHAADRSGELRLLAVALVLGLLWENLLARSGWLRYAGNDAHAGMAPYWLILMWALFAITLNGSLSWLKRRPWVAALFGAVGGPLAFVAGERMGAVVFVTPDSGLAALAALAVAWAAMTPFLLGVASRKKFPASSANASTPEEVR
jgi:hypothetical protein